MSGVRLFMFIVLIPALLALGHDVYLFAINEGTDNVIADAQQAYEDKGATTFFASLGFIWTNYEPESFKATAQSLDQETWKMIANVLNFKAFFVGVGFALFFYLLLGVMKLMNIGPFQDESGSKFSKVSRVDKLSGKGSQKFEYKRK